MFTEYSSSACYSSSVFLLLSCPDVTPDKVSRQTHASRRRCSNTVEVIWGGNIIKRKFSWQRNTHPSALWLSGWCRNQYSSGERQLQLQVHYHFSWEIQDKKKKTLMQSYLQILNNTCYAQTSNLTYVRKKKQEYKLRFIWLYCHKIILWTSGNRG